jgi:hypothetical protein
LLCESSPYPSHCPNSSRNRTKLATNQTCFPLFSISSKVVFITFVAICSAAFVQANVLKNWTDDGIYGAIHVILNNEYPQQATKTQCMVDDFRRNKIADKFYTVDLLTNPEKLKAEIQPYVDSANLGM